MARKLDQSDQIDIIPFMKSNTYSTYDAKAKFSEVLRKVQAGKNIVITSRGTPVARITPYSPVDEGVLERLDRLEAQGVVDRDPGVRDWFEMIGSSKGAIKRFLKGRGR